jgi:hypothetical protein
MSRRGVIVQRTPVLLCGEGKSEQGYGRWLDRLAGRHEVPVKIHAEALNGSDPLELVKAAVARLKTCERDGAPFLRRALLLDTDLRGRNADRDSEATNLAARHRFQLIWQEPCHEAFLLRHFPGLGNHRPPTVGEAEVRLLKVWPDYRKGQDATFYERVLGLDHLARARGVESALNAFLVDIGWN